MEEYERVGDESYGGSRAGGEHVNWGEKGKVARIPVARRRINRRGNK